MDPSVDGQDAMSSAAPAGELGKVLHVRNMPLDVTEPELIAIGAKYGPVANTLLLHNKGQGFIEMEQLDAAKNLLAASEANPQFIRGRRVYFQPSNHVQLKRNEQHHGGAAASGSHSGNNDSSFEPKPVLRVEIHNVLYVVTLDVLHQIFSKFGNVLRIITFNKNNLFQAFIQYADLNSAKNAKSSLDGQSIYTGCCQLRIFYSRLDELNVRFNNDKCRDYTNPNLPTGDNTPFGAAANTAGAAGGRIGNYGGNAYGGYQAGAQQGGYGGPAGYSAGPAAGVFGGNNAVNAGAYGAAAGNNARNIILVSNLNDQHVTPDILFMIIGTYADVHRVKILYNKKDTALVQVTDSQQAQTAIHNLNMQTFYGKEMRLSLSKHNAVALPRSGSEESAFELTKEYINSPLHRFKVPNSKNFANICPPIDTLHVSNIPDNYPEADLVAEFGKYAPVVLFRLFPNNHKMGVVKFGSTDEAMQALVHMNNFKIGPTNYLRVSFSKVSAT
ncbi:polypyrimidine tract-binding protein PTB-2 [Capsaspora owczarzaki ATCC 30864]|nr:polypyrimidine tract-binding protein PTB-2 [Capsaspora owczarzaki ATCC 30864]|eukprot:XP_004346996.2 polypyrimidine tract-binding protein PTB-2 [Capsaspora owczarzaki ATCC 30864]